MSIDTDSSSSFQLPPEVLEICDLAEGIVSKELMPLEPEFLISPDHAFGIKETLNLEAVFGQDTLNHLMKIAKDTGLWNLMIPEEFGGAGLSMLSKVAILEKFYYTAVPFPFANVPNILYECKGEQIEKYLNPVMSGEKTTCFAQTEPNAGSDPGGMMQTKAVRDGDDWIINGTKMWISMAAESDVMMVQVVTDSEKRQRGGITMFLVDRDNPGVKVEEPGIKTWLGPRASQYIVHFDDCRVSKNAILGDVGNGFRLGQRWLTIHDRLLRGPFALGKMQRALDMCIAWSKERQTFGKPLAERQAIQWKLVDMYIDIQALRALTYQMAARYDAGEDIRAEAGLIKLTSMDWGARCLDHGIQIHGAMGESLELPLTLFYRYLRHGQIGGGTSEIQRIQIARKLLKD
ncbi:MAG: acyl-CoA dehydrogenase family protein [Porticoccaceae bacterium]|jgi:alkylation response protein AidB-like acyl-CoA dehydrogenase|nr:acyl-CoA dehydrogenase family protein [Porticoccaceae bacterium]MBT3799419.1 acyl-CoA dehydrogenase family protein [Porticoccaceae bacterium]MBT4163864.1 acyl-CoA dehydrogenase family protein [Porticoccaceae bacterium]MBT4592211.1 acyl-CoA dehydrogenase family protein [Porticoccaceae bacterium]MBT5003218.1 acyl-CoA dehydrogenase family protein [Porticoccaceae bacterium]|tara:strand:- start:2582 stop:3793 length:1212 start_codon:yes stop_codon:yes gene_type:complete